MPIPGYTGYTNLEQVFMEKILNLDEGELSMGQGSQAAWSV